MGNVFAFDVSHNTSPIQLVLFATTNSVMAPGKVTGGFKRAMRLLIGSASTVIMSRMISRSRCP
ncbi:MAG: hypothetical protein M3N35_13990, partial [Candidatus Binatota bacterium]|nr:hypothetical protein [Candidatus Binatota bacterium]